jgi:hypothetical protein
MIGKVGVLELVVDVDLGQGSTHNRRSSVTPVASESVFQTFIITVDESTKKSQVLLQPLAQSSTTSPQPFLRYLPSDPQ